MLLRLQKYLADAQIASRRKSEEFILQGRVSINGVVIKELGTKVDTKNDVVCFDGKRIAIIENNFIYIMFHKPEGCVTTVNDEHGRKTVIDFINNISERIYPIGRLDYNTSGLLLLTNDGEVTYKLTHPKHNIDKTYIAKVIGIPSKQLLSKFERGLIIDGRKTAPAKIFVAKTDGKFTSLKIIIHEGRNRQVRKMCDAIGFPVVHLKRIATGKLSLGNLKKGEYRFLTKEEINYLKYKI